MPIRWHQDDPVLLREAIRFTAAETGFSPRLIEKDYFCSVVLEYLAASGAGLTFKGGTCLSKIHGSFYRLSEDLDFSIPTALDSSRRERSRSVYPLRAAVDALPERLSGFRIVDPLRGANNSTQYNALAGYESLIDGHIEPVSIEVGVREPNMTQAHEGASRTVLLNPLNGQALVAVYPVLFFLIRRRWRRSCAPPFAEAKSRSAISSMSIMQRAMADSTRWSRNFWIC